MAPVYGFCDANCKQPVYTVQEITTILEQLIQGGSLDKINPALLPIVAAIREQHNNKDINFWLGTEAELNAIDPVVNTKLLMARIDGENNLYLCSDDSTLETWKNEILAAARELVTGYATPEMGIHEYTQSSAGELTGSGANGKFKAAVTGTYSTIKVNGNACPVNCAGESEIELVAGAWYTFIFDGNAINFRGGGGLTNSKLAAATAETTEVLKGETFYSGDKVLKTGTLQLSGNAAAGDVLNAKTFYNTDAKTKQTGTMVDKSGTTQAATPTLDTTNSRLQMTIPATGKYSTGSKLYATYATIRNLIGLTAAKIVKGNTILGLAGTAISNYVNNIYYLIKNGVFSDQVYGGGWTAGGGYVQINFPSGSISNSSFPTAFDLTKFTTMTIEVSAISTTTTSRSRTFYITDPANDNQAVANVGCEGANVSKTLTIDVSNLSGFHNMYVRSRYDGIRIENMYLS